ncbi:MAG: enoyl-CoA hydratase/isomerase family protein [Mycobacterium leprae]
MLFAPELFAAVSGLSPPTDAGGRVLHGWQDPVRRLDRADLLTVAALAGPVDGAAVELALACDLRILSLDARLTVTDVVGGRVPALGGLARLRALAGPSRALELALTGRTVAADEAVGLGLATLAVPPGELLDAAHDLAAALLTAPRPAAVEAKALLRSLEGPLETEGEHLAAAAAAARRLAAGEPG